MPRAEGGLERGGDSLEGPRPSNETETRPRGWALERGRGSFKGHRALERGGGFRYTVPGPRARRRFLEGCGLVGCVGPLRSLGRGLYLSLGCGQFGE
jgi:hypothetical protein